MYAYTNLSIYRTKRGEASWEVRRRSNLRESPLENNKEEEAVRPGRRLNKTKPTSFPESPPVQLIKGLILIWLMTEILQVQPDQDSWALGGPQDYEPSQLPSDKQTRVTQMSSSSKQRCPGSYTSSIVVPVQHDVGVHINPRRCHLYDSFPTYTISQLVIKLNASESISSRLVWSLTSIMIVLHFSRWENASRRPTILPLKP